MSPQTSVSRKPPIAPMAGSFRPMRSNSASEMVPEDSKQLESGTSSKEEIEENDEEEEEEEDKNIDSSLKPPSSKLVSTDGGPRTVSFNEDTIVNSYAEREAPSAPVMQEREALVESPVNENMSVDEMLRKVEEKDDIAEESGNNYEVCFFRNFNYTSLSQLGSSSEYFACKLIAFGT